MRSRIGKSDRIGRSRPWRSPASFGLERSGIVSANALAVLRTYSCAPGTGGRLQGRLKQFDHGTREAIDAPPRREAERERDQEGPARQPGVAAHQADGRNRGLHRSARQRGNMAQYLPTMSVLELPG